MSRQRAIWLLAPLIFLGSVALTAGTSSLGDSRSVLIIEVDGTISTTTVELIRDGLSHADRTNAEIVVLTIRTPGGMVSSTLEIIQHIEHSRIPVVGFVYPPGSSAWSAGTMILLSTHIAAMSPHSIIGSSQPVSYSPLGGSQPVEDSKIVNAMAALMTEKARMHGRNQTAARLFVEKNLNLNDEHALRYGVIEVVAADPRDLAEKLQGRTVEMSGRKVVLETRQAEMTRYQPGVRVWFLSIVSDPLLASVALLVGIYALVFGLTSPGYGAEVVGAILLILGLIGVGLSINIAGLLLVVVGGILIILEAHSHSAGLFATAGIFCIVFGSLLLVPFEPSRWVLSAEWFAAFTQTILVLSSVIGVFTALLVYKVVRARLRKPYLGEIIGELVSVVEEVSPGKPGRVKYKGEMWQARSDFSLKVDSQAKVVGKDGPILIISPLTTEQVESKR